jgi:hypothetical protein
MHDANEARVHKSIRNDFLRSIRAGARGTDVASACRHCAPSTRIMMATNPHTSPADLTVHLLLDAAQDKREAANAALTGVAGTQR